MKVLYVEDHDLLAAGLKLMFQDKADIEIETVNNIDDFWDLYDEDDFDILMLDINIGKDDGLDLAEDIMVENPDQKIIMLTAYDLPHYHRKAKSIGVKAFVNKDNTHDKLEEVLRGVYTGIDYLASLEDDPDALSKREEQVLNMLARGYKQVEIADELGISRRTVNNHVQSLINKLQVNHSGELIAKGLQMGYVRLDNIDI